ncbi:heat shock factor protein 3-like isoform X2 [Hyperolius riggenbachi]|uniref:heat shock factor protein 3-like isoform X2 n=1 Tax=Hyperolius riggenbachi TaxID=752182 RepID=UPI0035A29E82
MNEPTASVGCAPVPAFLMKLWTLLEDSNNSGVITWNWNGQNFCILDDQRFSREILPKYFKHNNLSSFIRQLNMYGFRKVISLESGISKLEHGSTIEFQHPFFKKGRAELLELIKRKISSVKSEDPHLSQEDLHKVISELKGLKDVQSSMDTKLENMRRENQALWKEVTLLRRKHNHQQKLLTKVLQFILSLMRGNVVMAPKRKRQLTLEPMEPAESPPPKLSRHILYPDGAEEEVGFSSQNSGCSTNNSLEIHEVFSVADASPENYIQPKEQINNIVDPAMKVDPEINDDVVQEIVIDDSLLHTLDVQGVNTNSSSGEEQMALDVLQANTSEDPDKVISSILSENNTVSSSNLLERTEIQDYLSCIDASLEELQSMLSRKTLGVDTDIIDELFKPDLSSSDIPLTDTNTSMVTKLQENEDVAIPVSAKHLNKDKRIMQYTGNPLLSLFELPSTNFGSVNPDASDLLDSLEDCGYHQSSEVQNNLVLGNNSTKEPDLLVEDFSGSQGPFPMFVLSPVNKLIDEVVEAETP